MRKPFIITIVASLIVPFIIGGQYPGFVELDLGPPTLQPMSQHLTPLVPAPGELAAEIPQPYVAPTIVALPTGSAKAFIYNHESGNNPKAQNSTGCLGLGQSCPGSKLLAVCPNLDYACEDSYFTSYMTGRYGSWEAAAAFWQRSDSRPYPGHWW